MNKKNLFFVALAVIVVGVGALLGSQKSYGFAPVQTQNQVTTINSSGTNYVNTSSTVTNLVNTSSTITNLVNTSSTIANFPTGTTSTISSPFTSNPNFINDQVYNATAPTLANGQLAPQQADSLGNQQNNLYTAISGERFSGANNNLMAVAQENTYYTSSTGNLGTVTVKSGTGHLHSITIPTYVASASIICYDNTAGSGTVLTPADTQPGALVSEGGTTLTYDFTFVTGLTCVQSGASQPFTVSFH